MPLGLAGLWESRQSYWAGNEAQGMGYSLALLGVLSGKLTGRGLWGRGLPGPISCWRPGRQAELWEW